jgi:kynurenine formamidase
MLDEDARALTAGANMGNPGCFDVYDLTMSMGNGTVAFPVGLKGVEIERELRREEHGANADRISLSCHAGTHLDGPRHFLPGEDSPWVGDIPLGGGRLVGEGVVVDIAPFVEDYGFYGEKEILMSGAEVKEGDILVIHTGYHRFQWGRAGADTVRYFFRHPGPRRDFVRWCLDMKLNWLGIDCGSQDHPMNTGLRGKIPEEDRAFCVKHGVDAVDRIFRPDDLQFMHRALFPHGVIHVENAGGEISKVLNVRCVIGCFPLRIEAESSPCRLAAFVGTERKAALRPQPM